MEGMGSMSMSGMAMSMTDMAMSMTASMTGMAMPSGTASAAAAGGHGKHGGGMDMGGMGGGDPNACKISMLWNWNTVNSCFLSSTWHVKTKGMFAGSVLGVFFLCMALELLRRGMREYDRRITAANKRRFTEGTAGVGGEGILKSGGANGVPTAYHVQPTFVQHILRSAMYGAQFTAAFLVMLLGMYYNGFILFAIFLGHTFGYLAFGRDTCGDAIIDSGCAC